MRLHYLQHVPFEDPGYFFTWALQNHVQMSGTCCYLNESFPAIDSFDTLLIMGGPMSIHDQEHYPWLIHEKTFINSVIQAGKHVIGICLGAQLIADVLGATVKKNKVPEIGFYDIEAVSEIFYPKGHRVPAFHWHGETFSLPQDATPLFKSDHCSSQGFLYQQHVLAFQFHLESSADSISKLIHNCRDELIDHPGIQSADNMVQSYHLIPSLNVELSHILKRFFSL